MVITYCYYTDKLAYMTMVATIADNSHRCTIRLLTVVVHLTDSNFLDRNGIVTDWQTSSKTCKGVATRGESSNEAISVTSYLQKKPP